MDGASTLHTAQVQSVLAFLYPTYNITAGRKEHPIWYTSATRRPKKVHGRQLEEELYFYNKQ